MTTDIPAGVLEQLATAEEFAYAADTAVEITGQTWQDALDAVGEAKAAEAKAFDVYQVAYRAQELAHGKLRVLRETAGVVRTANGYVKADPR